ncbi:MULTISPECIES: YdiY family protein [Gemmobacter]|jgi:putative salt-induced outer membrane protein|uniref:Salt-stress induced outer membrane protein n=2 Tax=Gemmobacter TaxID=204456 RepID=A0ABQ3F6F7_9RHOB|nr:MULTISPECIES: DUF481 domain-containing protein [Gemmobacter]OJY32703.1 MAG: hypothetical protein BGP11_01655 [Rhodobacterales bacterium 65-51]PTX46012.1 putative salt-induced outer membrane protein [Gemmobacter caeni]TWI94314.1 putative salt-induced outer membrane protein [Gemmobacter caeni]GHC09517.1 salt-stress induced outer membrane protein [Gemmobacter nanjingensis]
MTTIWKNVAVSALALMIAAPAMAQTDLTGTRDLNDRIDDIDEAVAEDMARAEDAARFSNPEFRQGFSGSASLGYSGKTGNNESQEFTAGARMRYASGPWVQNIGVALDFADDDGVKTKEDVFAVYDANYYFNDSFYAFVLGRVETDGLAATAGDVKTDAFLGFGPGYRVVNTPDMTWRVQAGIGVSYLKDGLDNSETETGYIASSRFFYKFNENVFATNDTDILYSDTALRINNDLGVNFKMTDKFATRVSYLTEYNDSRAIRTDNKLGVSLVMGF